MLRLQADSAKAVETFIKRSVEKGVVWVLDDAGSVAGCRSNTADADVFPVFSDGAYARRGSDCWGNAYPPVEIPLSTYTDSILPYQIANGLLVGPNWDGNMAGSEVQAEEIAQRLADEIARRVGQGRTPGP